MKPIGETHVRVTSVLELTNLVAVMASVILLPMCVDVTQDGLQIPVAYLIVQVTQIVMVMVPAVQIMPYQNVFVMMDGPVSPVPNHVSMEQHKKTTHVFVILVILE